MPEETNKKKKRDQDGSISLILFVIATMFLLLGWKKGLIFVFVIAIIFFFAFAFFEGLPFLKKYVFEYIPDNKGAASKIFHNLILKPIALIVLVILCIIFIMWFFSFVKMRIGSLG